MDLGFGGLELKLRVLGRRVRGSMFWVVGIQIWGSELMV